MQCHARRRDDVPSEPIAPGDLLVLPVHGQQPVGDRRGHALGAEQQRALEKGRAVIKQIAVCGVHHHGTLPFRQSCTARRAKERGKRGVQADHGVIFTPQQGAELQDRRKVARREHAFFQTAAECVG